MKSVGIWLILLNMNVYVCIKNELIRTFAQLKNDAYSINDYIVR